MSILIDNENDMQDFLINMIEEWNLQQGLNCEDEGNYVSVLDFDTIYGTEAKGLVLTLPDQSEYEITVRKTK